MTALERLRRHPRVKGVDDERSCGNGVIVTLRKGSTFSALEDNRVCGEDSPIEIFYQVRNAIPFDGPFNP